MCIRDRVGGLSISTNGGSTFTNKTTSDGLGSNNVLAVFVSGTTVYAATANGLSISTDGGSSFANYLLPGSSYVNGVYAVGNTVYAATDGGLSISAPTVTSISPTSGSTVGGTVITITGTNLTGATGVTVGGTACTAFNVSSDISATCTTPAGTVGTASVVVTTPGGSNSANTLFTYVAVAAPTAQAVPTLSEWAQLMLGLMVISMLGWQWRKQQN